MKDHPLKGIGMMMVAVFLIIVMNMFGKMVSDTHTPIDIVFWRDEPLFTAVWRFASRSEPIKARLYLLRTVQPTPEDGPQQLALETHGAMAAVYKYGGGHEEDVIQSGI